MVQSLNKKVDLTINATSYLGMAKLNFSLANMNVPSNIFSIKTSMIIFKFLGLK